MLKSQTEFIELLSKVRKAKSVSGASYNNINVEMDGLLAKGHLLALSLKFQYQNFMKPIQN